jgi:hypothetical protein
MTIESRVPVVHCLHDVRQWVVLSTPNRVIRIAWVGLL